MKIREGIVHVWREWRAVDRAEGAAGHGVAAGGNDRSEDPCAARNRLVAGGADSALRRGGGADESCLWLVQKAACGAGARLGFVKAARNNRFGPTFPVAGLVDVCYRPRKLTDAGSFLRPEMPLACAVLRVAWGQESGRVDVSEPASISSGIAARYATALFELAKEDKGLKALEADAEALAAALAVSPDLTAMIASPVVSREDQEAAIAAIAKKMKLSTLTANTLALMAGKRRLFVLPQLVTDLLARIAADRGEVTAEVTSAAALSAAQTKALAATLKARVGKDVKLKVAVDETLIGGLVVKLGSTMIDTSVKAKLAALQNAMKEVG